MFSAAPRAALLVYLILCVPLAASFWDMRGWTLIYLLTAGVISAIVWYLIHTIGSMQYDKEHHETLYQQYQSDLRLLSIFPEFNPNPVIRMHMDGRVLYVNLAVRKILTDLSLEESSVEKILPQNIKRLCQMAKSKGLNHFDQELTRHGRTFHYLFTPFPDQESLFISGSDVTYLKDIEHQLRDLNKNLEKQVVERTDELNRTQDVTIRCMAGLAETRDPETGMHIDRTRTYVKLLAEQLRNAGLQGVSGRENNSIVI